MVRYDTVPMIGQAYMFGCWIASFQMLKSWAANSTVSTQPYCSDSWKGPNGGLNTDPDSMSQFADANGLTLTNGPSFGSLKSMISNGPIMAVGVFPGVGTHFYVIGGMDNDKPYAGSYFDLYDPLPVGSGKKSLGLSVKDFKNTYPQCCAATFQL